MSKNRINSKFRFLQIKTRLKYFALGFLLISIFGILTASNTYKNTHIIVSGKIINIFVTFSGKKFMPGQSNIYIRVLFENNVESNIYIPSYYNPQIGDSYLFEVHKSIIFNMREFKIKKKIV